MDVYNLESRLMPRHVFRLHPLAKRSVNNWVQTLMHRDHVYSVVGTRLAVYPALSKGEAVNVVPEMSKASESQQVFFGMR